jgi:hypothetical protein
MQGHYLVQMAKITIETNNPSMKINPLESCFDLVTLPQWQLMVARLQVQNVENLGLPKGIEDLFQ